MRRILIMILCCLLLTTAVSAAGAVEDLQSSTLVSDTGNCDVTLTLTLTVDAPPDRLDFPLPGSARDITVNGSSARAPLSGDLRMADLTGAVNTAGTHTVVIHYDLPDAVRQEGENLVLTLELLSGFSLPVDRMRFTVTLPGAPEKKASFVSTYLQESVESVLDYQVSGATISCTVATRLRDHENLTMRLAVTEKMFPQSATERWSLGTDDLIMYALALLALVYWLAAMRCPVPRRDRRSTPPEGMTAGEVGTRLCGTGVDFTMMVISWARMGYLQIHMTESGRVLLHKRMDMGNERSEFENRCFRSLFGRRSVTDGTGFHYAGLCRKASRARPGVRSCFRRNSGNPLVFRGIAAAIGFVAGISLAMAFSNDTAWRIVLGIPLSVLGAVLSWWIQDAAPAIFLRRRLPLILGLAGSGLWLLLCLWANQWPVAVFVLVTQWLAGFAAAFGGRRTETGKRILSELLGLRRYFLSASGAALRQNLENNPDYYYTIAPFALAMGVDRALAYRFGDARLPGCPWLTTGMDGHLTAGEWNQLLRSAVYALDERQLRLPWSNR